MITYPVIKPCQGKNFLKDDQQFFYAPIPGLIASRITSGIFYQMFNEYKTNFSDYFGLVFEKYVGLILQRSLFQGTLFSESEIREVYSSKEGMAPDWAFVYEETVILFECKIARFSKEAQAIANVEAVNKSLLQIEKGLRQLASFISACRAKHPGLENFHHCNRFIPILISLEPLYLINTSLFRKHIDNILASKSVIGLDWQILAVEHLESLQPHLEAGYSLVQFLDNLKKVSFNNLLDSIANETGKTFADSFLYKKQKKIYQHIGLTETDV
ncbi:MAG: hypothetical protein BJG00_017450 [Limnothrix sp. CACIAM 69d]|nr:MAG: hypothetical protein BJG00_017450 [Limnothrix sp. CACIAM 69d]